MEERDDARERALERVQSQAGDQLVRITLHAHEEMVEEGISFDEVLCAIRNASILEYYGEHRRGSCCLLNGVTVSGRPLHIVCTTAQPVLIVITVYEPMPPKWVTPSKRGHNP